MMSCSYGLSEFFPVERYEVQQLSVIFGFSPVEGCEYLKLSHHCLYNAQIE